MKKIWVLLIVAVILCGSTVFAGSVPLTTNGVEWGANYYNPDERTGEQYDGLPAFASPGWVAGYNTGSYTLSDSYVRIETTSSKDGGAGTRQTFSTKEGWDLSNSGIVEATLRVVKNTQKRLPSSGAQQICYGNEKMRSYVAFTEDSVRTSAGKSVDHDMTKWTTVRLVFENMDNPSKASVKIYINGGAEPVLINKQWYPGVKSLNLLRFGDMNVSSGGTVDWQSIRWRCE